jgi:dodecin
MHYSDEGRLWDLMQPIQTMRWGRNSLYEERLLCLRFLLSRLSAGGAMKERAMSMVKVIELSSESPNSWEDATRQAVERASRTLRNIRSVWVKEFEAVVDGNNVTQFRVNLKVSFLLDETQDVESAKALGGS